MSDIVIVFILTARSFYVCHCQYVFVKRNKNISISIFVLAVNTNICCTILRIIYIQKYLNSKLVNKLKKILLSSTPINTCMSTGESCQGRQCCVGRRTSRGQPPPPPPGCVTAPDAGRVCNRGLSFKD